MIRELCYSLLWTKCWDFGFNSSITHPDKPKVDYPECFQGKQIPVHGPFVAKLIEDRVLSGDVPLHWPSSRSDMEFYLRPPTHHNNTVFFSNIVRIHFGTPFKLHFLLIFVIKYLFIVLFTPLSTLWGHTFILITAYWNIHVVCNCNNVDTISVFSWCNWIFGIFFFHATYGCKPQP